MGLNDQKPYRNLSIKDMFCNLFIKLFANYLFQALIPIIYTIVIGVTILFYEDSFKWWASFLVICFIVVAIQIISAIANRNLHKNDQYSSLLGSSLEGQVNINSLTANNLFKLSEQYLRYVNGRERVKDNFLKDVAGFQKTATMVCDVIHAIIKNDLGCKNCQVTIFQQFNEGSKNYIQMVAYKNSEGIIPASFLTKHYLDDKEKHERKPVVVKIFEDNEDKPTILSDKKSVQSEFSYFEKSKFREEQICQYIGIPTRSNRNIIAFVLQVDVANEKVLGSDRKEIQQITCDVLSPYNKLLHSAYELEHFFETIYNNTLVNCN